MQGLVDLNVYTLQIARGYGANFRGFYRFLVGLVNLVPTLVIQRQVARQFQIGRLDNKQLLGNLMVTYEA